jgi:hypothetical protein
MGESDVAQSKPIQAQPIQKNPGLVYTRVTEGGVSHTKPRSVT